MSRFAAAVISTLAICVTCGEAPAEDPAASSSSSSRPGFFSRVFSSSSSSPRVPQPNIYDKLLFHPTKYPQGRWDAPSPNREDAWFAAADGTKLHGWYCPCETPRAVVLVVHGNAGNVSYMTDELSRLQNELRVATLAFDYRGYGRSEGKPTVAGSLDDARSARAWLARRTGIAEREIVLIGRSLGGAVVVQLAAEMPPRGLVLESTFSSLRDVAGHHFSKLAWMVPAGELNSVATLAKYEGALLQSHGDADRTIPFAQGEKLFAAARGPKEFYRIEQGDHNDPQPAEYYLRLARFIDGLPRN